MTSARNGAARGAVIDSSNNVHIKRARSLLRRKAREKERAFLVEGRRAVEDAIEIGVLPEIIFIDENASWIDEPPAIIAVTRSVNGVVLATVSDVVHTQGVIAIFSRDALPKANASVDRDPLLLIVDDLRDPGNLGTLIRSAAGAGVTRVVTTGAVVDPFNPKCVRAAMGGHFRIPIEHVAHVDLPDVLQDIDLVAVADAGGRDSWDGVDWTTSAAVIVGGETTGPSAETRALATHTVRIPLSNGLESLNAGVAGSLLLFEAARQRNARNHR